MSDLVPVHKWRREIPKEHRTSLDTRLLWLWHQRFGTVQTVYNESPDLLDKTAATLILQAVLARDLKSIQQLFQRLEGSTLFDQDVLSKEQGVRI